MKLDHAASIDSIGVVDVGRVRFALDIDGLVERQRLEAHEHERRQIARLIAIGKVLEVDAADLLIRVCGVVVDGADDRLVVGALAATRHIHVVLLLVLDLADIVGRLGARLGQPAEYAIELDDHTRRGRVVAEEVFARARRVLDEVLVVEDDLVAVGARVVILLVLLVLGEEEVKRLEVLLVVVGVDHDEVALRVGLRTEAEARIDLLVVHDTLRVVVGGLLAVHAHVEGQEQENEEATQPQVEDEVEDAELEPGLGIASEELAVLGVVEHVAYALDALLGAQLLLRGHHDLVALGLDEHLRGFLVCRSASLQVFIAIACHCQSLSLFLSLMINTHR